MINTINAYWISTSLPLWTLACQDKWPLTVLFAKFLPCLELGRLKTWLRGKPNLSPAF